MLKFLFILTLLALDIFTKQVIFNIIDLNNFIRITSFIDFTHIHNFGISFGLFSGKAPYGVFVILGIIICILIIYMMQQSKNNIEKWGYSLIIAGGFSNIFDRYLNGYVIDFIYFHYKDFYWPAFNLADIYISIGVVIILFQSIKDMINKKSIK